MIGRKLMNCLDGPFADETGAATASCAAVSVQPRPSYFRVLTDRKQRACSKVSSSTHRCLPALPNTKQRASDSHELLWTYVRQRKKKRESKKLTLTPLTGFARFPPQTILHAFQQNARRRRPSAHPSKTHGARRPPPLRRPPRDNSRDLPVPLHALRRLWARQPRRRGPRAAASETQDVERGVQR